MEFQDRSLHCLDCRQEFVFSAGEQEFYERKGFKEIPKRCRPCRESRKVRRNDETHGVMEPSGVVDDSVGNRMVGGPRPEREMFDAVCASCGTPARVPFRPAAGRPVYCRDCYSNRQGQGPTY